MADELGLPAAWPGFTAKQTVVLAIDARVWPPPPGVLLLQSRRFEPKAELHVTLIGAALGARVHEALAAGRFTEGGLVRAFESLGWVGTRTGQGVRLAKLAWDPSDARRQIEIGSVIELIELPAMAAFHVALGNLLGAAQPVPPPHVTLYTSNDDEGIGVPDAATLEALTQGRIALPR